MGHGQEHQDHPRRCRCRGARPPAQAGRGADRRRQADPQAPARRAAGAQYASAPRASRRWQDRQAAWRKRLDDASGRRSPSSTPSAPSCPRTASSSTRSRRSALPPGWRFRSTSRARSSRPATRTISAGASPPRSARRTPAATCRWCRSPATAASCSPPTKWRPRSATAFRSTAIVFNDGAFGNVRRIQQERFGNRLIASDLANPDFVRFAESFGAAGERARSPQELRAALRRAFARRDGPTLIEVPVGPFPTPWPFIFKCRRCGAISPMSLGDAVLSPLCKPGMELITTTEELAATCERLAAPPLRHHRHRIPARDHLLSAALRGAAGEQRRGRGDRRAGARHRPQAVLRADGEREACSRCSTPRARTSKSSGIAPSIIPHPIFDTQVAAMVLGYGDSISYDQLVQRITGDTLDKSNRFTDWTRRPLSPAQVTYAVSDVTHLRDVYHALVADLGRRGRADWMDDEMEVLTSPDTYRAEPGAGLDAAQDPGAQAQGACGADRGRGLARARGAEPRRAARRACSRTTPSATSRCRRRPRRSGSRRCARCPRASSARNGAKAFSKRSSAGSRAIRKRCRRSSARSRRRTARATVELLKVLLRMTSERHGVAAKVIATVDDLDRIAADDEADVPALKGWRRELFGERALGAQARQAGARDRARPRGRGRARLVVVATPAHSEEIFNSPPPPRRITVTAAVPRLSNPARRSRARSSARRSGASDPDADLCDRRCRWQRSSLRRRPDSVWPELSACAWISWRRAFPWARR